MPLVENFDSSRPAEHNGFSGELGINFVQAVAAPVKGCAQLAGYKVDLPRPENDKDSDLTGAEKLGKMVGSGLGTAALYVGSTALLHEVPGGVGVRSAVVGGALGFLNPITDPDKEGLGTRTANAALGATTNLMLGWGSGVGSGAEKSFLTSLTRTSLSSGAVGLFNTQAESLLHTGHMAGLSESATGAVTWAFTGAAFHGAGAAFRGAGSALRGLREARSEVYGGDGNLRFMPERTTGFVRNPDKELQMAADFTTDMKAGVTLQKEVGPWIAVLGSSAPKPGSATYLSAFEVGQRVAQDLHMPVATGNGPGVMAAANEGAFKSGGKSVGIYLEGLPSEQNQNTFTTNAIRCKTLLARQHLLLSGADGLVIAPDGGGGTVFEYTHQLIEMRRKVYNPETPIVFVDENKMWGSLRGWFGKHVVARGLMRGSEFDHTFFAGSPSEAVDILRRELHLPGSGGSVLPFETRRKPLFPPVIAGAG